MSGMDNTRKITKKNRKKKTKIKKNRILVLVVLIVIFFFVGFGTRYMISGGTLQAESDWVNKLSSQESYDYRNTMVSVIDRENNILKYVLVINQSDPDQPEGQEISALYIPGQTYFNTPGNEVETLMESYHEGAGSLVNITEDYFDLVVHDYVQLSQSIFEHLSTQLELEHDIDLNQVSTTATELLEAELEMTQVENSEESSPEKEEISQLTDNLEEKICVNLDAVINFRNQVADESSILNRPAIRSFIGDNLVTNLDWEELDQLVEQVQPELAEENLSVHMMPGQVEEVDEQQYLIPDHDELEMIVEQNFLEEVEYEEHDEITVEILDGYGDERVVGEMENLLEEKGFQIVGTGEADSFDYRSTQVISRTDSIDAARQVALEVEGADLLQEREQDSEVMVTVIIGENYSKYNEEDNSE